MFKHFMNFFLILSVTLGITLSAQNNERALWKPLFGANMENATYDPIAWTVENGILQAHLDEMIWTMEEYENFELDLEFKNEEGTNSGVVIYCTDAENWIPNSVEIQIADDYYEPWSEAQGYEKCGAIFGHLAPRQTRIVKKPGEWNHMRIRCTGKRISVILNGRKVTEMDMSLWTSGTENPDGSSIPSWLPNPFAQLPTNGYIGLQGKHGEASVYFRNVKIRELSSTEPTSKAKPTPKDSVDRKYSY